MPRKLLVTDELKSRDDAFTIPKRFREFKDINDFSQGVPFVLSKKLTLTTPYEILSDESNPLNTISDDIIGAGFSLNDEAFDFLHKAVSCGIPSVLLSAHDCYMTCIHIDFTGESPALTSKCGLDDQSAKKCGHKRKYCNAVSDPDSVVHKNILAIALDPLFSPENPRREIVIPIFQYSLFLSLISWRSHLGKIAEQVQVDKAESRKVQFKRNVAIVC